MAGQLYFPTAEECDSSVIPTRKITVPATFEDVIQYKQVFKAALRGELNLQEHAPIVSYQSFLVLVKIIPRLCNYFIARKGVKDADARMHKYGKLPRMNPTSPMRRVLNFVVFGLHLCLTCSFGTCEPRTR